MNCPACNARKSSVEGTFDVGMAIYRKRACKCGANWATCEMRDIDIQAQQESEKLVRPKRKVSAKARLRILARDGFKCCYCGGEPPEVRLHVDHVLPLALGGSNHESNLVAACEDCNFGKGHSQLADSDAGLILGRTGRQAKQRNREQS